MTHTHDLNGVAIRSLSHHAATPGVPWQAAAITAHQRIQSTLLDQLRQELAARIRALTGQVVHVDAIVTEAATQTATATVGAVAFQLRQHTLVLVRPCSQCGTGRFYSPALDDAADVGFALAAWEPRCASCAPDDEDWSHSF